jgi:hypothetical protein
MDNQSSSPYQRIKIKSLKSVVKVVRDLSTKKWVFIKKDK